jgi:hypothetical protein
MSTRPFHRILHLLLPAAALWCSTAAAQDAQLFGERSIQGTARYTAMAGAMASVGADPSAVLDNPAGLGLYRRMEVSFSFAEQWQKNRQMTNGKEADGSALTTAVFSLPQASLVFALENRKESGGLRFCNFMLSFNRLQSFNRTSLAFGSQQPSIASLMLDQTGSANEQQMAASRFNSNQTGWLAELGYWTYMIDPVYDIDATGDTIGFLGWDAAYGIQPSTALKTEESGYVDEYTIHWAGNIDHHWFVGAGLNIRALYYSKHLTYEEALAPSSKDYTQLHSYINQRGTGISGSAGLIYRPLDWFRAGLSVQTPVLAHITTRTNAIMGLYKTDGSSTETETPFFEGRGKLTLPLRTTVGTTFLIGQRGMVSLQYDYRHVRQLNDVHTLKAGFEAVPLPNLFLNAGYACESSFLARDLQFLPAANDVRTDCDFRNWHTAHYASAGIGYRGHNFIAQLAYQFRWQDSTMQPFAVSDDSWTPDAFDMNTMCHRVVVTLAWHTR